MQRWFFLGDGKPIILRKKKMAAEEPAKTSIVSTQNWLFTVSAAEVGNREKVFITGNTPELGEWDYTKVVLLDPKPGSDLWCKEITIPNTFEVLYRYGICLVLEKVEPLTENSEDIVIKCWETNVSPRIIKVTMLHPVVDMFGHYDNMNKISRGWLTCQTLVQFKFMNNPLKLKSKLADRNINIKVTPVKLSFGSAPHVEDSLSTDSMDVDALPGVCVEVATLDNNTSLCSLQSQEQFGREYKQNDILIINVCVPWPKSIAYLVDFYSYSTRASSADPPCHVGYTYVLPNMFKPSEGALELPVTCNIKHRPLGTVCIEYVIIKPMEQKLCNLEVSFAKHWNPSWTGLEVGHRGLGASFKTKE